MVRHVRASGKITTMFALGAAMTSGCGGGSGAAPAGAGQPAAGPAAGPADEELVALSLVADAAAVVPGQPLILAARFDVDPAWHIYWENPGEAGLATEVTFTAPPGFAIGPVRYPGPMRFTSPGPVESFGYDGTVLLSAPVHPPATLTPEQGPVSFVVEAFWLACRDTCVRGSGKAELTLPVAALGSEPAPAHQALMDAHAARLPRPWPASGTQAWEAGADGPVLVLALPAGVAGGADLTFFPSTEDQLAVAGQEPAVTGGDKAVRVRYRAAPARARGVLGAGEIFYRVDAAGPAGNETAPAALP
jgi:DsbC/DsbD-like thiol-disulfide interchange protein